MVSAESAQMTRIAVVGVTGAGKSTFATALSNRLEVLRIELDALYWGPQWTTAPPVVFRARVAAAVAGDAWIADGDYAPVRNIVWSRADTVIWLEYCLRVILARLLWRTGHRWWAREELWHGNRERLVAQVLSRDSPFLSALKIHSQFRRDYPKLLASDVYSHLQVLRFRAPHEACVWLASL